MSEAPTKASDRGRPKRRADRRTRRGLPRRSRGTPLGGRYRLRERIATGGSAEVWLANDERLDRPVAVKVLHRHLLPDAATRRRFAAEARATAALSHPGIVAVHDVVEEDETVAIVLQHVEGETLADRIRRAGALQPDVVADIGAQLAAALAHAHRAGVVHRDVKPANVVIDRDDHARLVDFGIARLLDDAEHRPTAHDEVVGTLRYMAPEQLSGGPIDARTDLYSLGLVLAEMLLGEPVFRVTSPAELVARSGAPLPDLLIAPPWLRTLIERLLAVDPERRPASARAVALALGAGGASGHHRPAVEGVAEIAGIATVETTGNETATVAMRPVVPDVDRLAGGARREGAGATGIARPARSAAGSDAAAGSDDAAEVEAAEASVVPVAPLQVGRSSRRAIFAVGVLGAAILGLSLLTGLADERGAGTALPADSPAPDATAPAAESVDGEGSDPGKGKGRGKGGKGGGGRGRDD